MRDLAREYGLSEVAAWPIQVLTLHCAVLRIPAGAERDSLLQKIAADSRVKLAQPMNGFAPRTQTYNDPYLAVQRGFQSIDAAGAQQWSRGEKVRVAVIDTGLDAAHPDFGGRVAVRRNFVDRDARRFGLDRHGTAVAGVISASANNNLGIVGVAPGVEIIALKACWQLDDKIDTAHCNSLTLAQALAAAISENAQVVNLSLAGPRDPLLNALVAAGTQRGVIYVGAAPADAPADGFPGGTPGVIPVDMAESPAARSGVLRLRAVKWSRWCRAVATTSYRVHRWPRPMSVARWRCCWPATSIESRCRVPVARAERSRTWPGQCGGDQRLRCIGTTAGTHCLHEGGHGSGHRCGSRIGHRALGLVAQLHHLQRHRHHRQNQQRAEVVRQQRQRAHAPNLGSGRPRMPRSSITNVDPSSGSAGRPRKAGLSVGT